MSKTPYQELGDWGEEIASQYLEKKRYKILDRNFRRKWGEIDIICSVPIVPGLRNGQIHERISRKTLGIDKKTPSVKKEITNNVPRGTLLNKIKSFFKPKIVPRLRNGQARGTIYKKSEEKIIFIEVKTMQSKIFRPEEQVTHSKQKRLIRSCQLYLSHKKLPINTDWQIDVIGILLDKKTGKAKIEHIERAVYFN